MLRRETPVHTTCNLRPRLQRLAAHGAILKAIIRLLTCHIHRALWNATRAADSARKKKPSALRRTPLVGKEMVD